jgi:hypothetical protein
MTESLDNLIDLAFDLHIFARISPPKCHDVVIASTTSPVTIDTKVPAYFLPTYYRLHTDFPDFTSIA